MDDFNIPVYKGLLETKNLFGIPLQILSLTLILFFVSMVLFREYLIIIPFSIFLIFSYIVSKNDKLLILIFLENKFKNYDKFGF